MTSQRWQLIEDLPESWRELASTELASLASIWTEQADRMRQSDALKQFNERLRREWAIETGIIENLYTIDRGITLLLIEKGIEASLIPHGATDKPVELVIPILKDQEEALEGLFGFVAHRRALSTSYLKQLHQVFTRHQETVAAVNGMGRSTEVPLLRGEWKKWPNNPLRPDGTIYEYCPPEHVAAEMDRLMEMHARHMGESIPPEVEAAWLHHRFTQIHPFQDGNGRIARALASLIFLRAGWFPLVVHRDMREEYIRALEVGDQGDLRPLTTLFTRIQKKAFLTAFSISENVLRDQEPFRQVITAAADRLRARAQLRIQERQKVFDVSRHLEEAAQTRLKEIANALSSELRQINFQYSATADRSAPDSDHWFKKQIVDIARQLDYYADTRSYRAWVRLKIREERQAELVLSFHSLGVEFLGIMVVSAFIEYRDRNEDGESTLEGPYPLHKDVFQFSYNEHEDPVTKRFQQWLNDVLLVGLDQWRRQL